MCVVPLATAPRSQEPDSADAASADGGSGGGADGDCGCEGCCAGDDDAPPTTTTATRPRTTPMPADVRTPRRHTSDAAYACWPFVAAWSATASGRAARALSSTWVRACPGPLVCASGPCVWAAWALRPDVVAAWCSSGGPHVRRWWKRPPTPTTRQTNLAWDQPIPTHRRRRLIPTNRRRASGPLHVSRRAWRVCT